MLGVYDLLGGLAVFKMIFVSKVFFRGGGGIFRIFTVPTGNLEHPYIKNLKPVTILVERAKLSKNIHRVRDVNIMHTVKYLQT